MIDYNKPILNKNGEPLKILMSAAHFCIRVVKESRALKKLGYEIHGLGDRVSYGAEDFDTYSVWKNEQQFKNSVALHIAQGVDAISFHNEPDAPVSWIREVIQEMNAQDHVKLVADLHDIDSVRRKENIIPMAERNLINDADALIYCSLPIQEMTNKLHRVTIPNITLYSYCNKGIIEYDDNDKRVNAIVYEGGINPLDNKQVNEVFPYRNLFPILQRLIEMGNEVHAYVGNGDAFMSGQTTGVVMFPPTEYEKMMEALTKYKYGVLIFNNEQNTEPQVKYTLTNKAQEYLQAGLPSLACWCEESEKWVRKHKIGLTFNHIDEVGVCSQYDEIYPELMQNIRQKREELVMENFIWKLENLYAELLGVEKKAIPDNIKQYSIFEYGKESTEKLLL